MRTVISQSPKFASYTLFTKRYEKVFVFKQWNLGVKAHFIPSGTEQSEVKQDIKLKATWRSKTFTSKLNFFEFYSKLSENWLLVWVSWPWLMKLVTLLVLPWPLTLRVWAYLWENSAQTTLQSLCKRAVYVSSCQRPSRFETFQFLEEPSVKYCVKSRK